MGAEHSLAVRVARRADRHNMSSSHGWRVASIAATLLLCSTPTLKINAQAPATPRDSIEGKWAGMAGLPTDRVAIAFEIKRDSVGKLRAYLYQQVSNFYGLELPGEIVKQGDKYVLKEWALNLTPKAGGLEGTLYSIPVPISLARTTLIASRSSRARPASRAGTEMASQAWSGDLCSGSSARREGVCRDRGRDVLRRLAR